MIKNIQEFTVIHRQYGPPVGMKVELLFVGETPIVKTFVRFLGTPALGSYTVSIFRDLDKALAYVEAEQV